MNPGIVAAIAAVAVFAMTIGVSYPLLALILESAGMSETFIGVNAAMSPLGILASAPLIPWAAARVSSAAMAIAAVASTALLLAAFAIVDDFWLWFPLRFLLGVAINVLFVLSDTWVNQLAPAASRGRVVALYATVMSIGFAAGPATVGLAGSDRYLAFAVAIGGTLITVPVLHAARHHLPGFPGGTARGLWTFSRSAPVLLAAAGAIALFDQTTLSLTPVFALRVGFDEASAAYAVAVLVAGNVLLQLPIGWLADTLPRRWLLAGLLAIGLACAVTMPWAATSVAFWPIIFVWGGVGYGAYTVTLAELGARFTGAMLLAGNAAFAVMWGVGGIVGPAAAGVAMDLAGPNGLPLTLGFVFATLFALVVARPLVERQPMREAD